jgi:hypothetical protein
MRHALVVLTWFGVVAGAGLFLGLLARCVAHLIRRRRARHALAAFKEQHHRERATRKRKAQQHKHKLQLIVQCGKRKQGNGEKDRERDVQLAPPPLSPPPRSAPPPAPSAAAASFERQPHPSPLLENEEVKDQLAVVAALTAAAQGASTMTTTVEEQGQRNVGTVFPKPQSQQQQELPVSESQSPQASPSPPMVEMDVISTPTLVQLASFPFYLVDAQQVQQYQEQTKRNNVNLSPLQLPASALLAPAPLVSSSR